MIALLLKTPCVNQKNSVVFTRFLYFIDENAVKEIPNVSFANINVFRGESLLNPTEAI